MEKDLKSIVDDNIYKDFMPEEQKINYERIFGGYGKSGLYEDVTTFTYDDLVELDRIIRNNSKTSISYGLDKDAMSHIFKKLMSLRNEVIHGIKRPDKLASIKASLETLKKFNINQKNNAVEFRNYIEEALSRVENDIKYFSQKEKYTQQFEYANVKYQKKSIFGKIVANINGEKKRIQELRGKSSLQVSTLAGKQNINLGTAVDYYNPHDYEEILGELDEPIIEEEERKGIKL